MLVAAPTPVADPVTMATLLDDVLILMNPLPFVLLSDASAGGDLPTEDDTGGQFICIAVRFMMS